MKNALTYDDVAQAASLLLSKNERPTTRNIRLMIGRGSFGTISRYLNEWREKASPATVPPSPEENLSAEFRQALGKEIARHLQKCAQEKDDEISRLRTDLQEALSENDRLEALCSDQEERIKGLAQEDIRKTERATLLASQLADEKTRSQDFLIACTRRKRRLSGLRFFSKRRTRFGRRMKSSSQRSLPHPLLPRIDNDKVGSP